MDYSRVDYAIHVLKTAPKPRKFNLNYWLRLNGEERLRYHNGDRVALNGCGTTGCGIGWIASDPSVIKEGFYLQVADVVSNCIIPVYQDEDDLEAAAKYFDIDVTTAETLFYPSYYPPRERRDPKYVIQRMELLLAAGEDVFLEMTAQTEIYIDG